MNIYLCLDKKRYKLALPMGSASLFDICVYNGLPAQSMSFYVKSRDEYQLITGLHDQLCDIENLIDEIIVRPDRNINYFGILEKQIKIKKQDNATSEYSFSDIDGCSSIKHIELNAVACQNFVTDKVKSFLSQDVKIDPDRRIVLGVSGGGDSNALLHSFLDSGLVTKDQLLAVMMLGVPDWDLGKNRAEELCQRYNIELEFVCSDEINKLMGRKISSDWVDDFEKYFPKADLEIAGTYAVRLAIESVANSINAQAIVTGLNLEDILAECFFQTMKGKLPLPFPVRPLREIDLWYPLYQCPKKIIDGCYPKYSIQNYMDRYQSKMLGRALPYYAAQMMNMITPGLEYDMLNGFKKISETNKQFTQYDEGMGIDVLDNVTLQERKLWDDFLSGR